MDKESFDVVIFDLGPLLQSQTRTVKSLASMSFIIAATGLLCLGIHHRFSIKRAA